jgi:ATP-binding cassette, subfamily C (CFTR/MRP), member 1
MASTCQSFNDDTFGPVVHGCRSNFDFTLLFEQSILSIGPAALLLLLAPPRLVRLLRSSKKTLPSRLRFGKTVSRLPIWNHQDGS